jgi:hypothetical protein
MDFNRLSRSMYIAYWYHVAETHKGKAIEQSRGKLRDKGAKLMNSLLRKRLELDNFARGTLPALSVDLVEPQLFLKPDTQKFLTDWISLLDRPEQTFGASGRLMLTRREEAIKKKSRARLGQKHVSPAELKIAMDNCLGREYSYSYRFYRAVTVAYDIALGLRRREE